MEEFVEHLRMLASTLGVDVFEPVRQAALTISEPNVLKLRFRGRGYEARAVVREGRVVVSKDSFARKEEAPSLQESSRAVRAELLDSGVLRDEPKGLVFTQDYAFDSASGAAQAICASTVNGRTSWKLDDDRALKDGEEEQAAAEEAQP